MHPNMNHRGSLPVSDKKGLVDLGRLMSRQSVLENCSSAPNLISTPFPQKVEDDVRKSASNKPEDYELIEEIGIGSRSTVWKALCKTLNKNVAVKRIDLEQYSIETLEHIRKEVSVLSTVHHPNIVTYLTSFVNDTELWLVMDFLEGGSVADVMRYKYPEGLPNEEIIATILKHVLQGLHYFHSTNQIHRDIKAGNILVGSDARIQIADFGLSAHLVESGDRVKNRNTFVGSFCWAAPEVMKQDTGYDYKADIWSFGITALELAHGVPPYFDGAPMKVMYEVLRSPPPQLIDSEQHKWSKKFREFTEQCLQKDPAKRPNAAQLLKHKFLNTATKETEVILIHLLNDVPPLSVRVDHYKKQQKEANDLRKKQLQQKEQESKDDSPSSPKKFAQKKVVSFEDSELKKGLSTIFDKEKTEQEEKPRQPMSGWNWEESFTNDSTSAESSPKATNTNKGRFQIEDQEMKVDVKKVSNDLDDFLHTPILMPKQLSVTNLLSANSSVQSTPHSGSTSPAVQTTNTTINNPNNSNSASSENRPRVNGTHQHPPASNSTTIPASPTSTSSSTTTSPVIVAPKRQFRIKDVSSEEVELPQPTTSVRVPVSGDSSITGSVSVGTLSRSTSNTNLNLSQDVTLASLSKQVNELSISNQQIYKVLNMVYTMTMQQKAQTVVANTNSSTANHNSEDVTQLLLRLQEKIDSVCSDNAHLKHENDALKQELNQLKKNQQVKE
ncbi:hypothetical protein AKO1_010771 [Acrasis kona]|uniref:Protein kinase domain-containing protein n=1 Tax=Acrasis kona TaxID=1008807 RepID=A0AAW2YLF8_9EUKA